MRETLRPFLLCLVVGALSLAVTALAWRHEHANRQRQLRGMVEFSLRETTGLIEQRIAAFEQILHGLQGLFDAVPAVDDAAFQRYAEALLKGPDAAGVLILGYAPLTRSGKDSQALSARIAQVAPPSATNQFVLGFDQLAEPTRRTAMLQSRDTGRAAITDRLTLVRDRGAHGGESFIMFLPLYAKGATTNSVEDRQEAATGWVYTSMRVGDLMATLYGEGVPGIVVRIYDGIEQAPHALIYQSSRPPAGSISSTFQAEEYLNLYGHTWTVAVAATPEFEERFGPDSARIIGLAGLCLSGLMVMLTWQLAAGRARARSLAEAMTAELRESEAKLRLMARLDPLTRLPNRILFSDRMKTALAAARRNRTRLCVMFVDLDRFKPINDTYGHAVGDQLLISCAARMRQCIRESDTVARIGGDEFVVMLAETPSRESALVVADKIARALAAPFEIEGHSLTISASVGVSMFPEDGTDELALMKHADHAMYREKQGGGDRVAGSE